MKRFGWFVLLLSGCREAVSVPPPTASEPVPLASQFDPTTAGTIEGRVRWDGPFPDVKPLVYHPVRVGLSPRLPEKREFPNPNQPIIDSTSRGVGNAVIFLRGVDPQRSRPWDQPTVTVEMRDYQFHLRQRRPWCGAGRRLRSCPDSRSFISSVPMALLSSDWLFPSRIGRCPVAWTRPVSSS